MNKINEQIKKIHEQMKKRGEWDGLPPVCTECPSTDAEHIECNDCKGGSTVDGRNAYIAEKLDLITESIVFAMKARREGLIADKKHSKGWKNKWFGNRFLVGEYGMLVNGYYESYLALALIRTMDLMGFYGVEYSWKEMRTIPVINDSEWKLRDVLLCVGNALYGIRPGVDCSIHDDSFDAIITAIIDIAELDKIDIQWHLDARLKYESGVK